MLNLKDLKDREKFDTPEWTQALVTMSLAQKYEINDSKLYENCLERIQNLAGRLDDIFVGKTDLIDLMCVCSVAQLPLLMLGTWGTAKSMLVRMFTKGLGIYPQRLRIDEEDELVQELLGARRERAKESGFDADALEDMERSADPSSVLSRFTAPEGRRHFEYLVTRFTTPEEILGGVNVDLMLEKSVYLRNTKGFLPRAEIVFLDEVFKANSSILNALLSVLNERLLHNAGAPWDTNMLMLFGASNEPPQEADLGAFYDRFPVRALCDPVKADALRELIDHANTQVTRSLIPPDHAQLLADLAKRAKDGDGDAKKEHDAELKALERLDPGGKLESRKIEPLACVNDLRVLNMISRLRWGTQVPEELGQHADFDKSFFSTYHGLRNSQGISDRSGNHFYQLTLAHALLKGRTHPAAEDCVVFKYCSNEPEAARKLPGIVADLVGAGA